MNPRRFLSLFLTLVFALSTWAQQVDIVDRNGEQHSVQYSSKSLTGKGIYLDDGTLLKYKDINKISTADFDAFDRISRKTAKQSNQHIELVFTGDENVYAKQLESLRKKRTGADVARAAGGVMMILGVLSGDRGLTAAGLATNAGGQIARSVNDDRTSNTQTAYLNDLDRRTREQEEARKKAEMEAEELKEKHIEADPYDIEVLRKEFGKENVDGLIELVDGNHDKALAYANVGELSEDANHRISSVWLKAMIEEDREDKEAAKKEYERLITLEPDIETVKDAEKETHLLIKELNEIRKGE